MLASKDRRTAGAMTQRRNDATWLTVTRPLRLCVFASLRLMSAFLQLSPRIQIVELQNRIQHQRITPDRLPAVHRIDREEHQVPLPSRRVDHDGPVRDLAAALEEAGDQEIALRCEAEHHARSLVRRDDGERI